MKKSGISIVIAMLLLVWASPQLKAYAEQNGTIQAEVSLMDDYGEVLEDYITRDFQVKDGEFVYRKAPEVEGYMFATANVLRLENEKGSTYRVHYFYTLDEMEPAPLPAPVPLEEMPVKRAPLEQRQVWVSWADQDMKEIKPSEEQIWDFFWETYEIRPPDRIDGYAFQRLETGRILAAGGELPHFLFIYRQDRSQKTAPSLISEHRIKERVLPLKQAGTGSTRPLPGTTSAQGTASPLTQGQIPSTSVRPFPQYTADPGPEVSTTVPSSAPSLGPSGPKALPVSALLITGLALAAGGILLYKIRSK